jgi:endoglucanase
MRIKKKGKRLAAWILSAVMLAGTVIPASMESAAAVNVQEQSGEALDVQLTTEQQTQSELTPVSVHGRLHVDGTNIKDEAGEIVQLHGVSTHGINWDVGYPYVNQDAFQTLRDDWGVNAIRLAMYTDEYNGYCAGGNQTELKNLIDQGVTYATNLGMYVTIDWHILNCNPNTTHLSEAISFWDEMSAKYKDYNNVLYEICNEPNGCSWDEIKEYANQIIPVIRANDPNAIIIVGTPTYSQLGEWGHTNEVADNPLTGYTNIMYSLHFYCAESSHTQYLPTKLDYAISKGLPVFVTEFGMSEASGSGSISTEQAKVWLDKLDSYNVSYNVWSLSNKDESSALIQAGNSKTSGWSESDLTDAGKWIRSRYQEYREDLESKAEEPDVPDDTIIYSKSGYTDLEKPTQDEIIAMRTETLSISPTTRYTTEPSVVSPYATGTLDDTFLKTGEAYLNYNRYLAGLGKVTLNESMNTNAQYGAVLLASIDTLTHTPSKPDDMDDSFYSEGKKAAGSSNISWSYGYRDKTSLIRTAVVGCMEDNSSSTNLACLGHRRWFLNPAMGAVGFGCADSTSGATYVVSKAMDASATVQDYDFIAWPASGNFPQDLVTSSVPWSITLNPDKFDVSQTALEKVSIQVTRVSDNTSWTINADNSTTVDTSNTFFKVNTDPYGVSNCIIFNIGSNNIGTSLLSGTYHVEVSGLTDSDGNAVKLDYTTEFFDASKVPTVNVTSITLNPTSASLEVGDDVTLEASVSPANATNKNVTWSSDKESVATVDQTGKVEAVGAGEAKITCTAADGSGVTATAIITVTNPESSEDPEDPDVWPFVDVAQIAGNWKYEGVKVVYKAGIMTGTSTDKFSPDTSLTRAMFVATLYRLEGRPDVTYEPYFSDVQDGQYYSKAATWAYEAGIITGFQDGTFGVKKNITRDQIAKMLYGYAVYKGYDVSETDSLTQFKDTAKLSDWSMESIQWIVGSNIMTGKSKSGKWYIDPKGYATRAECAALLARFMVKYMQ